MSLKSEILAALKTATVTQLYLVCSALNINPDVGTAFDEPDPQMYELHFRGRKDANTTIIFAVKWYREWKHCSLREAKDDIDSVIFGRNLWLRVADDLTEREAKLAEEMWTARGYIVSIQESAE